MSPDLIIGIDAGGTRTRLAARSPVCDTDVRLEGPAANLLRAGADRAGSVLVSLIRKALPLRPGHTLGAVCVGMAGAGTRRAQRALRQRLGLLLPVLSSLPVKIVHDGATALEGAFGGHSGLLVIAGTGSVVYGRSNDGSMLRAGGWGYLIGDEGSGHAIGVRGLHAVAQAFDEGAETALSVLAAERHGIGRGSDLLHRVYQEKWPVQHMARLVLEASENGDPMARHIVEQEADALTRQAARLVERSPPVEPKLALCGGLANSSHYTDTFAAALQHVLPGWKLCKPAADALEGAIAMAERLRSAP